MDGVPDKNSLCVIYKHMIDLSLTHTCYCYTNLCTSAHPDIAENRFSWF